MEGLTPNSFSHQIRKSVDALRRSGISVSFRKSNGERLICLRRADGVDDPAAAKSVPIDPVSDNRPAEESTVRTGDVDSSLLGGQAEPSSDFVGLGAAGNWRIPAEARPTLRSEVPHETEKGSADYAPAHAGAVRQHRRKAEIAQMPVGAYVRAAALRHRVVVIDGLKEITHELKGIGRSINQLVLLCNMGRIKEVHLGDAWQSLSQVYLKLQELTDREVR